MSFTPVLASPQYTKLRSPSYGGDQLVSLFSNRVVFQCQINTDLTTPTSWASFLYNNVTIGAYTDVKEGMEVYFGTSSDIKAATAIGRTRRDQSGNVATSTTLYVNENSSNFAIGTNVWVVDNHVPHIRLSRPSTNDPTTAVQLVDWNLTFQQLAPRILGLKTAYAGYVDKATSKLRIGFDVSGSQAATSGASMSTYTWSLTGAYIAGTSSDSIIIVDFDPGEQWVSLQATDSGSRTLQRWIGIKAHDDSNPPDTGFSAGRVEATFDRGYNFTIPAFTGINNILPDTTAIVWRDREQYGGVEGNLWGGGHATITNKALTSNVATLTTSGNHPYQVGQKVIVVINDSVFNGTFVITAVTSNTFSYALTHANISSASATGESVVNPENIDFVGWLEQENDTADEDINASTVEGANLQFTGIASRLARMAAEGIPFTLTASPALWGDIVNLTPWRAIWQFLSMYTTIASLCDVQFDSSDNTLLFPALSIPQGTALAGLQVIAKQINAYPEYAAWGGIAFNREAGHLTQTQRNALPIIANFDNEDAVSPGGIQRTVTISTTGKVDGIGTAYNSSLSQVMTPMTARAPGSAQGEPGGSATLDAQILAATPDVVAATNELRQRVGDEINILNTNEFLDVVHPDGYVGMQIAPGRSQLYQWTLSAVGGPNDVDRIDYTTAVSWIVDSVTIGYDEQIGGFSEKVRYRRVSDVGDLGDDTTQVLVPGGLIIPAVDDIGLPAFNFELPELTVPQSGLTLNKISPRLLKALATTGQNLLIATNPSAGVYKAYWLKNLIYLTTPQAIDVTPSDLGSFQITAVAISPLFTKTAVPAYILANDGTNSAVWYTANVAATAPIWTKGANTTGVYTTIRTTKTSGSIFIEGAQGAGCTISDTIFGGTIFTPTGTPGQYTVTPFATSYSGETHYLAGITVKDASGTDCCPDIAITGMTGYTDSDVAVTNNGHAVACSGTNYITPTPTGFGSGGAGWQQWYNSLSLATVPMSLMTPQSRTSFSFVVTLSGITISPMEVIFSTNNGSTWGSVLSVGDGSGKPSGFDVQSAGNVSYAPSLGAIYKATTLGGTYSSWATLPSGNPVCIIIPYYKRNTTTLNTSTSTPDVIVACDNGKLYWIDGATATSTDITPSGMTTFDRPDCVTVRFGNELAVFGKVSGTYHLKTSTDGGATWTDIGSITSGTPMWIRCRRQDTRPSPNGQLYLAAGESFFSSFWASHTGGVWVRHTPTHPVIAADTFY